jgi:hypothetical protein
MIRNGSISRGKVNGIPEKQSIRDAMDNLFAKNRDIRPLNFGPAFPMNDE